MESSAGGSREQREPEADLRGRVGGAVDRGRHARLILELVVLAGGDGAVDPERDDAVRPEVDPGAEADELPPAVAEHVGAAAARVVIRDDPAELPARAEREPHGARRERRP